MYGEKEETMREFKNESWEEEELGYNERKKKKKHQNFELLTFFFPVPGKMCFLIIYFVFHPLGDKVCYVLQCLSPPLTQPQNFIE